ncbi:hypothetical protein B0H21DRAFT_752007, partial [Amylocystis lapponica]
MDAAITPPLRIQTTQAKALSSQAARVRLDDFLVSFHARNLASGGGDSTNPSTLRDEHNLETERR